MLCFDQKRKCYAVILSSFALHCDRHSSIVHKYRYYSAIHAQDGMHMYACVLVCLCACVHVSACSRSPAFVSPKTKVRPHKTLHGASHLFLYHLVLVPLVVKTQMWKIPRSAPQGFNVDSSVICFVVRNFKASAGSHSRLFDSISDLIR